MPSLVWRCEGARLAPWAHGSGRGFSWREAAQIVTGVPISRLKLARVLRSDTSLAPYTYI